MVDELTQFCHIGRPCQYPMSDLKTCFQTVDYDITQQPE